MIRLQKLIKFYSADLITNVDGCNILVDAIRFQFTRCKLAPEAADFYNTELQVVAFSAWRQSEMNRRRQQDLTLSAVS